MYRRGAPRASPLVSRSVDMIMIQYAHALGRTRRL